MDRRQRIPLRTAMIPDSFKVLPLLSPELPPPPPAPKPVRVAPLSVSRRDQSAFVILQESNSRPSSRSPTPVSGRVSPFRGRGFKTPNSSRHPSREPTPERSRSKLPIARPTGRSSVSSSPSRNTSTSIPKPIIRRKSLSPSRATRALNQINRNKSFVSKSAHNLNVPQNTQSNTLSPSKRLIKPQASPKRVGPLNVKNQNSNLIISKPPIPKTIQKKPDAENSKQNNLPPGKKQTVNNVTNKSDNNTTRSPSRIPKSRNENTARKPLHTQKPESNQKSQPSQRPPPRLKPKTTPTPQPRKVNDNVNSSKENENTVRPPSNSKNANKFANENDSKKEQKKNNSNEVGHDLNKHKNNSESHENKKGNLEKQSIVDEPPITLSKATHSTEMEPTKSNESTHDSHEVTSSDGLSIKSKVTITSNFVDEDIPETSITWVRATTAPSLELAQPDVIPNILSQNLDKQVTDKAEASGKINTAEKVLDKTEKKEEHLKEMAHRHIEIKENVLAVNNGGMPNKTAVEQSDDMATLTGLSVESVRSTSSVETVRAVAKVKANIKKHEEDVKGRIKEEPDAEVLSANNLIRTDSINNNSSNRTVAWEHTSPGENSVYPVEPIVTQPTKAKGCCGKFVDRLACCKCCKTSPTSDGKCFGGVSKYCRKLNCCKNSSCCKKQKKEKQKPLPRQKKSKLKECLSKLNCCRSIKCCKKSPRPIEEDNEDVEPPQGCCDQCKNRTKKCCNILFCMNLSCCQKIRNCSGCTRFACCRSGGCCGPSPPDRDRRKSRHSLKRTPTSLMVGLPKLDSSLVEHSAFIRSAIPVLPVPLAWICLIFNVFLPGTGTLLSGMFCLCVGKPRFSINDSHTDRLMAFCVNVIIAISQVFSIIFCLVGWGWSIWWGVIMLRLAKKNRRIKLAEKNAEQPVVPVALNQNHDVERAR